MIDERLEANANFESPRSIGKLSVILMEETTIRLFNERYIIYERIEAHPGQQNR